MRNQKKDNVVTLDELQRRLRRRESVIFTHGTFDLFHVGHLALLEESKKLGSVLVVGVDHDENVPRYKGKKRPVFRYEYRVALMSRVSCVDFVLPLLKIREEDGADYHYLKLYMNVQPNVITHGVNFEFSGPVQEKCKVLGVTHRELDHKYSHLSTSGYIREIIEGGSEQFGKHRTSN